MNSEPYVYLCHNFSALRGVLVTPLSKLEFGFDAYPNGIKTWRIANKDGFYTGFCSLDAKDFKAASEITADSPEEYVLKLAAMGFVYGGEEES